ncbi:hypothetical protein [Polyangium sorediatum]|uniref:Uncharacterized protein n=1 Tax=Polyangium sorediatum TaxID=889274 RepID=A0ABT6P4A0_9BACT|nr:hypothetical protein [Polyangium sorediatum]MDI1435424.1 hypothetical protein [Polyangium sorediatum]
MKEQQQQRQPHVHVQVTGRSWFVFWVEFFLGGLFFTASILGIVNVFASTIEVDRLASETACMGQPRGCEAMPMKWERVPWAHTLQVNTTGGTINVRCSRAHVLLGAWSCDALNALPEPVVPSVSASASASSAPSALPVKTPPRSGKPIIIRIPSAPAASAAPRVGPSELQVVRDLGGKPPAESTQ